ncbi:MAG TPA: hypothetical protein PKN48_06140 [Bacteroidales bacterium]|nr:hypothetical protein [Bacteroidales bacterium]
MPKNYLIGIGGTGAKVVESVVNMCAAGYGPEELSVFLIDPDAGNGNLNKTITLIKKYNLCYDALNIDALSNRTFFKTKISISKEDKGIYWSIFEENSSSTLSSHIYYTILKESFAESYLGDLVDVLFSENELKEPLNKGFRGHPSIGSVVMSDPPKDKDPFKEFFNDIKTKSNEHEVKVFLAGSIFGGTGAAGVPTLGADNLIKGLGKLGEDKNSVLLGAALILPYFSFSQNNDVTKEKMFVTNEDFPIATKGALEYYSDKGLAFDQLYFIGDNLLQDVGEFSVGSSTQKNDPHYIEIVVGMAAFDFFNQKIDKSTSEKKFFIAARDDNSIGWTDFPVAREDTLVVPRQNGFKLLTSAFTTFAYSFCTYGKKARMPLDKMINKENYIKQDWYKKHEFDKVNDKTKLETDIRYSDNVTILNLFEEFLFLYLNWICAIDIDDNIKLIDSKQILVKIKDSKSPPVIQDLIDPENKSNISNLLKSHPDINEKFPSFLVNGLNQVNLTKKPFNKAAIKFLCTFYEGSMKFCAKNYNIQSEIKLN